MNRLRIPGQHHAAIIACKTLEDLTNADIPESTRERIFDVAYTPDYERVLDQPSFETGGVDDLLRYVEGELLDFLLKLDPEQERYVTWALNGSGPTLVKGSPGTGKSTIALYRVKSLQDFLKTSGVERPKILFTTYTNALVASSRQLLFRMLGPDSDGVSVKTADSLVMNIFRHAGNREKLIDNDMIERTLQEASRIAQTDMPTLERRMLTQLLERLSISYIEAEIESVIIARELKMLEEYLKAPRTGRKVGLNQTQRTVIWKLHTAYAQLLASRNLTTWSRMRQGALEAVRDGVWEERFDGVIVDESQDLQPTVLRLLVSLCKSPDRLFVTADANQSIYGSSFRWTDVHQDLRFTGRTGVLRRNHRSTREIGEATQAYLQAASLEALESHAITYSTSGPFPTVRWVSSEEEETELLVRFLRGASREFRLGLGGCAVLVPGTKGGQALASRLTNAGINAEFMSGRELNLESKNVKVITQKSAKGLEFPVVAVAGLLEWPKREPKNEEEAHELEEALLQDQRTLFVSMTRAMRALLVVLPEEHPSALFDGFEPQLWNVAATSAA